MKYFEVNLTTLLLRFYLMMAVIIIGVFTGQLWMAALGLPIFLSCMLGVSLKKNKSALNTAKVVNLPAEKQEKKVAM